MLELAISKYWYKHIFMKDPSRIWTWMLQTVGMMIYMSICIKRYEYRFYKYTGLTGKINDDFHDVVVCKCIFIFFTTNIT